MNKFLLVIPVLFSLQGCLTTETGEKIGNIVKFGKTGFLCSTYEAELIRGGLNNGNGSFGKSFEFTVEDKEMVSKINDALDKQQEVKIKYHREAATFCRSETNVFLDSVEIISK